MFVTRWLESFLGLGALALPVAATPPGRFWALCAGSIGCDWIEEARVSVLPGPLQAPEDCMVVRSPEAWLPGQGLPPVNGGWPGAEVSQS